MKFMKSKKIILEKCAKIKLILTDVDGVLTDGGRYFSENGEIFKKFHVRDGMAVNILLRNNIKTIIVTKESSKIVKKWGKEMNVDKIFSNSVKKESKLRTICNQYKLKPDQIGFIGDDVNDLELLKLVGFSATTNDSVDIVKDTVDYVCKKNGGQGAFREIVDLILKIKLGKQINWY